ncbi:hypothetical protein AMELA_G00293290 [Ameiurus melas]|uniref:Uncharacterized protein n=1 Tax=Ameiurus melas TaxID=219545 RepID=A0A7J5ZI17_AMEME|nr:hypothetical protein AMELA_G00293290 [Ameiurus melas]
MVSSLEVFQRASSARVNWNKTDALLLGEWQEENIPHLPQECSWSKEGLRILGIFFGTDRYMQKNWDGLTDKVIEKLNRWRLIQSQLSHRGRVLVINNLAASMLWHRLTVLDPPQELLHQLQKCFVDFVWSGHHWIPSGALSLLMCEGGQSLILLQAKVKALRLQTAQKLLYYPSTVPWVSFGLAVLRFGGGIGLDRQLFLMSKSATKAIPVSQYYGTVFKIWAQLMTQRKDHYGLNEPLFYNTWFPEQTESRSEIIAFISARVAKVGDLIDQYKREWIQVHQLSREIGGRSERIVGNVVRTLKALFPTPLWTFINDYMTGDPDQTPFPEMYMTPSEAPDNDGTGQLLSYARLRNVPFSIITKDQLYNFCMKNELSRELKGRTDTKWRIHLSTPPSQSPTWRVLYKRPLPKRSGDLQWRVLHSAMPTNTFLFKCNLTDSPLCSRVFPDKDSLFVRDLEIAGVTAGRSPVEVQGTKINLLYSRDHSVTEGLDYVIQMYVSVRSVGDITASARSRKRSWFTTDRITEEPREQQEEEEKNASVQTTLSTWGLRFENKLLYLTGRVLPAERILQGARAYEYNP